MLMTEASYNALERKAGSAGTAKDRAAIWCQLTLWQAAGYRFGPFDDGDTYQPLALRVGDTCWEMYDGAAVLAHVMCRLDRDAALAHAVLATAYFQPDKLRTAAETRLANGPRQLALI